MSSIPLYEEKKAANHTALHQTGNKDTNLIVAMLLIGSVILAVGHWTIPVRARHDGTVQHIHALNLQTYTIHPILLYVRV